MASSGLGKGLNILLAESAQQRTLRIAPSRTIDGVKLLLNGDGGMNDSANAVTVSKHTDAEAVRIKYVLFSVDAILLVIAIWMHTVSRAAHWSGGLIVSYALVGLGCVLGYVATPKQPRAADEDSLFHVEQAQPNR